MDDFDKIIVQLLTDYHIHQKFPKQKISEILNKINIPIESNEVETLIHKWENDVDFINDCKRKNISNIRTKIINDYMMLKTF